jgi:hypothetical protein
MQVVNPKNSDVTFKGEGCEDLPVKVEFVPYNGKSVPCIWSEWELSEEERLLVLGGGRIKLGVLGGRHPPVILLVE